jgi:phage terminase large subunit-like protein
MKTFQINGRWFDKKFPTAVLTCVCGYKYIKTRLNQTSCIKCLVAEAERGMKKIAPEKI